MVPMTQPGGSGRRLSLPWRLAGLAAAAALAQLAGTSSFVAAAPVTVAPAPRAALAAPGPGTIKLSLRASGLTNPVFVTSARDGSGRLFIVEQTGRIRIFQGGNVLPTPFLTIGGLASGTEQGLLGLAFHPSFPSNHKLYVNLTNADGDTLIREYRVSSTNPNVVDTTTARNLLKITQPYDNHNGGMLAFDSAGYLYIGMGDGGGGGDPGNRAQSTTTLLGKMLRINPNGRTSTRGYLIPSTNPYVGKTGLDEIWQIGLRNPWRFSFDRANGNLWIGDVGQSRYEEIDRAVRTSAGAGRGVNWGWRVLEGAHCFNPPSGCNTTGKKMPITEYGHSSGRCSVTGGYVYRGTAIPALVGSYLFADYCTGEIWWIAANAPPPATRQLLLDAPFRISSFGEDAAGELYVLDHGGAMYAVVKG
jgi:glucose/arabinose dehydrogenase